MSVLSGAQQGRWTVTDAKGGQELLSFQSFLDLNFRGEAKAPEQPVEQGSFATYNKISTPNEAVVNLAVQGGDDSIGAALNTLEELAATARLINVETPDRVLTDYTLTGYSYVRKRENGLGLLLVELNLKEVRQVAPQYTDTAITVQQAKNPTNVSPQDGGKTQTEPVRASVLKQITG